MTPAELTPALDAACEQLRTQKSETEASLTQAHAAVAEAEKHFAIVDGTNSADAAWEAVAAARSKRDRLELSLANVTDKLADAEGSRQYERKQRAREEFTRLEAAANPVGLIDADAHELAGLLRQISAIEARMVDRSKEHDRLRELANAMIPIFDAHRYSQGVVIRYQPPSDFAEIMHARAREIAKAEAQAERCAA